MAVFAVFLDWHTKQKTGTRQIAIPRLRHVSLSLSLSFAFPFQHEDVFFAIFLPKDYEMHSAGGVCAHT